jgi:hypothetical protein
MSTTTPNFGWVVPTSSDLVKNGAVAIETLGDSIDASMVDLKGGTTGQVLSKTSNTDMDFTWTTASSAPSVNLLLNSNFALNQRAYVSAANLASGTYGFDRWKSNYTNTTLTFTASTQGQSLTINASGGLQQIIEQGLVSAGTYTLSWTGTATGRVYNSGGTPPSYAASPVTFTADGTANVVVEFTAVSTTKTLSKVQFNAGTSTAWALATPTLQTELAACQRYYQRYGMNASQATPISTAFLQSTTDASASMGLPVSMRVAPTAGTSATADVVVVWSAGTSATSNLNLDLSSPLGILFRITTTGLTTGQAGRFQVAAGATKFFDLTAEL